MYGAYTYVSILVTLHVVCCAVNASTEPPVNPLATCDPQGLQCTNPSSAELVVANELDESCSNADFSGASMHEQKGLEAIKEDPKGYTEKDANMATRGRGIEERRVPMVITSFVLQFLVQLGPWMPLALFFLSLLLGFLLIRTAQIAWRIQLRFMESMELRWRAIAPPFLAEVHPLRYALTCMLLVISLACCFPIVINYYAEPLEPATGDCPSTWSFFSGRCFTYLSKGFDTLADAQEACQKQGGQLALARNARENEFLKNLVLSVGQMSPKFDFSDDFLGPKEVYGTQVWHSYDPSAALKAQCSNPSFSGSCPALCERKPEAPGPDAAASLYQLVETVSCSLYYASVLLVVFHSPVEHLLCNSFILWVQNGMDHDVLKQLKADWLTHPSCGVVLLAMLQNKKFTKYPRLYLCYRILCAALVLALTAFAGRLLRSYASLGLPGALQERWQHRNSPRSQFVQRVVFGLITDVSLLPFFFLVFMRQETLRNQMEIVDRPKDIQSVEDESDEPKHPTTPSGTSPAEAVCRICHEGGSKLISPCACKGSMAFAHATCLNKWREYTHSPAECDVCRCPYTFRPIHMRPLQLLEMVAAPVAVVIGRTLTFLSGMVSVVGLYTQGAILYVLATKQVRIHYLCTTASPTDFHFELNQFPVRHGPTAELERAHPDQMLFFFGVAFYLPLVILWGTNCWYTLQRYGYMWDDLTDFIPYALRTVFTLVTAHCAFNHVALAWPAVASSLGRQIPALPAPLGLREFLIANYVVAIGLTILHSLLAEAWLYFRAIQHRRLSSAMMQ